VIVINDRLANPSDIAGCLKSFDPNSIESVDILKPAAAAGAYGKAASSGAIVITLKKGVKPPCDA
jgi:hypothetical protein